MSYLVADIGATWARFAKASRAGVEEHVITPLADFQSVEALIEHVTSALELPELEAACLAVAGPRTHDRIGVVNGELEFSTAELEAQLRCSVQLVNDFYALGHSLPALTQLHQVGGGAPEPDGVKALIGPGTGLGMSLLVPDGRDGWLVVASEGGHADLAAGSPLELELVGLLQQRFEHVCWETVLSGSGLENLYRAVAELWGVPAEDLDAAAISAAGESVSDPMCHQTLELFCGFLGAAAGNLAVTAGATGGIYLGGGILPRIRGFLESSPFRRRFEERGVLTEWVSAMPVFLILDEQPGLTGAWRCLVSRLAGT